jgi:outer membrane immunogenic protein
MKRLVFACIVLLALAAAGPVVAADMRVKAPVYKAPPAMVAAHNWTGFYVGGSIGGRWADPVWTTTCLAPMAGGCFDPARLAFNNPARFDSASFRGGVYGGYNWQLAPMWVVGVEGDFAWARNRKTIAGIPGADQPTFAPGDTATVKQTWDAGVRGRVGFLIDPKVLLFATGGASWTRLEATAFCGTPFAAGGFCDPISNFFGTASTLSKTLTGWTVGGGIEWMFAHNWLARGEYRYADYGRLSGRFFPGFNGVVVYGEAIDANVKLQTHTGLFGIAYKFGDFGKGPVVARY